MVAVSNRARFYEHEMFMLLFRQARDIVINSIHTLTLVGHLCHGDGDPKTDVDSSNSHVIVL